MLFFVFAAAAFVAGACIWAAYALFALFLCNYYIRQRAADYKGNGGNSNNFTYAHSLYPCGFLFGRGRIA